MIDQNKIGNYWTGYLEIEIEVTADLAGNTELMKWWLGREPYPSMKMIKPTMSPAADAAIVDNLSDGYIPDAIDIEINFDYQPEQLAITHLAPENCQPGFDAEVDVCAVRIYGVEYTVEQLVYDPQDAQTLRDHLEEMVWDWIRGQNDE